ncbi:PREDICTED: uncharacterized protein LOC106344520 [Brassica oleracea var. oleracea]|uniref:uncharacterized protein LOC106308650 n=1 Tax=Brassica oleracea var. oleracea TaxID=109376 RepID=UPI0006A70AF8|nr:PREDICTED: uncharacterized protein LOC106308650 [Brassica oleracea var. oleracea]XP_013617758.1 PREDICTED: uncharacterized protein LOC106324314 [Brassica oleracea var. oleracea]XP_013623928.1 PREDICTED: uncharacterized protein LOC106329862 [Brassica oleracea var. oleracea]XP_013639338.1 PREDICTED: uncharacterized protein LOC106344520 [Brassica oleracea var. oleracea]
MFTSIFLKQAHTSSFLVLNPVLQKICLQRDHVHQEPRKDKKKDRVDALVKSMQGSMDRFLVKSANLNESGRSGDEFDDPMEDENEINDEDVNEEDKEVEDDVTDVTEEDDNLSEKENEDVNDQVQDNT